MDVSEQMILRFEFIGQLQENRTTNSIIHTDFIEDALRRAMSHQNIDLVLLDVPNVWRLILVVHKAPIVELRCEGRSEYPDAFHLYVLVLQICANFF